MVLNTVKHKNESKLNGAVTHLNPSTFSNEYLYQMTHMGIFKLGLDNDRIYELVIAFWCYWWRYCGFMVSR